jgi:hypothetical protein
VGHIVCTDKIRNTYRILIRKPHERRLFEKSRMEEEDIPLNSNGNYMYHLLQQYIISTFGHRAC